MCIPACRNHAFSIFSLFDLLGPILYTRHSYTKHIAITHYCRWFLVFSSSSFCVRARVTCESQLVPMRPGPFWRNNMNIVWRLSTSSPYLFFVDHLRISIANVTTIRFHGVLLIERLWRANGERSLCGRTRSLRGQTNRSVFMIDLRFVFFPDFVKIYCNQINAVRRV